MSGTRRCPVQQQRIRRRRSTRRPADDEQSPPCTGTARVETSAVEALLEQIDEALRSY
jgi:hypothetical protein